MINNTSVELKAYLESLPRINCFEECHCYKELVYLLPKGIDYEVNNKSEITTNGLSPERDIKTRDLIRVIVSEDPLHMLYRNTNVLTPLMYAESLPDILWHITTQAILYTKATSDLLQWISQAKTQYEKVYKKHNMDHFWLTCSRPIKDIKTGDCIAIFNRRVDGWDGTRERPVIELLGTGGHLPTVWDSRKNDIRTLTFHENLQKEAKEELGLSLSANDIHVFGGYNNLVTHELVILSGIEIPATMLPEIEYYAIQNLDSDTMGVYLGTLPEVIDYYRKDPCYFAGGVEAASTNFPNQTELMNVVERFFLQEGIVAL